MGEAGADGDSWLLDLLGGGPDVNPELTGIAKFFVYDEMRKTDASVKSTLLFRKLPIRAAHWGLNPRSKGDGLDLLIRDYCAENLGLEEHDGWLDLSWDEVTQQGLQMLEFGLSFEELVWGDIRTWYDADGDAHLVRPLDRIAPRPATSIAQVRRNRGRIIEVVQSTPNANPIRNDDGRKIVHMVWEREGDRWDGVSMLRAMWGAWRLKKALMLAAGIGWDRFASGLPVIYHPDSPEGEAKGKAMGRNIRQHERGYAHIPKGAGMSKDEADYVIDILNGSATLADPVPLLQFFSDQIAEAGCQQAMRQGLGQTGARATAETQIDPFFLAVQSDAEYLRRERSRQVIRQLVEVNFGAEAAEKRCPLLTVSKIQSRNVQVLADAISVLEPLGLVLVNQGTVDDVHELLGLPAPDWDEDTLGDAGLSKDQLLVAMRSAGVEEQTLQRVVAALPEGLGVGRNRVAQLPPGEGEGLAA